MLELSAESVAPKSKRNKQQMPADNESVQAACTLGAADHAARIAWIEELNATALSSYHRVGHRMRLRYHPTAAAKARELVRREQECCPFLHFTIEEDQDAFVVIMDAPAELSTAADALFAPYTRPGGQTR
jgi:hypothetical protein